MDQQDTGNSERQLPPRILLIAAAIIFLPGFLIGPIHEDFGWMSWVKLADFFHNTLLSPLGNRYYRPLATLVPYKLADLLPGGFLFWRAGQILGVAFTAWRLWLLLQRLAPFSRWATIGTLLWLAEYGRPFGVYYFNATDYLLLNLSLVFFLGSLLDRRWAGATLWLLMGLGAKEQAVTFPLIGMLLVPLWWHAASARSFFCLSIAVCSGFLVWRLNAAGNLSAILAPAHAPEQLFGFPLDLSMKSIVRSYQFLFKESFWLTGTPFLTAQASVSVSRIFGTFLVALCLCALWRFSHFILVIKYLASSMIFFFPVAVLGSYVRIELINGHLILSLILMQQLASANQSLQRLIRANVTFYGAVLILLTAMTMNSLHFKKLFRFTSESYFTLIQETSKAAAPCPNEAGLVVTGLSAIGPALRVFHAHALDWGLPHFRFHYPDLATTREPPPAAAPQIRLIPTASLGGIIRLRAELLDPHGVCRSPENPNRKPRWEKYPFGVR
ncbi:MAG: hypothetical protein HUU37_04020 [Bdellovibrionales bacterium]|nr:hypothetical protein [Bdellovibrionales bacterium]